MVENQNRPILFLAFANDRYDAPAYLRNLAEESRRLRATLKSAPYAHTYTVEHEDHATLDGILNFFQGAQQRSRVVLFHFGGHAESYRLLSEQRDGGLATLSAVGLAQFLASQQGLRLVFLNACATRAQVQGLLDAGVEAVIATRRRVDDKVAMTFAARFYNGFANGATLKEAFNEAAAAISADPALHTRAYGIGADIGSDDLTQPWVLENRPGAEHILSWRLIDVSETKLPFVDKDIEFYTCYISYSTEDQDFAEQLHADLQAKGVRCWFAPDDMAGGKKISEQIDQAIKHSDKLLVVLSESSMASEWVKTEIYQARQYELEEQRRKLFPIRLVSFDMIRQWKAFDADIGKDMAREIREYFIPDFINWKDHDAYQKAFSRLLRDMKSEAS